MKLACIAAAIALLATTGTVSAQTAQTNTTVVAQAQDLFDRGRLLLREGRFDEACDLFRRSEELDDSFGTLINIGECFERKKQYASAWGAYSAAVKLAVRNGGTFKDAVMLTRAKAAAVEPLMSRLTLDVDPSVPGLSITRNGTRIEQAALNTAIPVDSGSLTVVVTAPNRKTWQGKLELRQGEVRVLHVPALEVLPDDAAAAARQAKIAVGFEIGGGVVVVTGLVFGGLALSAWSSVEKTCPAGHCTTEPNRASVSGDQKRASTFAAVSTVTILVGAVALATGITLHLTTPAKRFAITPAVDRTSGGFLATFAL